ncbi:class I adenylate-forming enzyme family protein [Ramlibacter algicola]|uniref:AMP-binding protein n=1 Tax=Ramlibacter algicola TaxID=2795217 RepID=A0A934PYN0_9BURK|nr:AMP-binding protein [Ramlibacter algicola]MBK0391472.1 AMP-binding protein [Ramlibacter algicola]
MAVAGSDPSTLAQVLQQQARLRGDAVALHFGDERITYAALDTRARRVATLLSRQWGVQAGDRVAWLGLNDPALLVLLFALARVGAMLLPLNIRLAPAEWQQQLDACTPRCLVHDAAFAEAARALGGAHALHATAELDAAVDPMDEDRAAASVPALLVFTSGTTSRPKAAVHTQANLVANMRIAAQVQAITPRDRVLTVLPLFHVGGLCIQTLPALSAGATVLLQPRFMPDATLQAIAGERPTLTLQVPATLKALIEHPAWANTDLSSLRAVWAGSSLLPASLLHAFHARGVPVCNVYGATETGPFSIALGPQEAMQRVGSCGWPAPGVEMQLAEGGEVWVRGPNVVARYWPDEPALDAQGWFHTGDLATRDADGACTIVGRAKDLIISGGENIHPAEIEAVLGEHPAVLECAAFGLPDAHWGEAVAVAVVLRPASGASDDELRAHLAARLARFKLPRHWLRVEQLPKTALGKVQRHELVKRLRG